MWRCIAVSPTIMPPLSPPYVPSGISASAGMTGEVDAHESAATEATSRSRPPRNARGEEAIGMLEGRVGYLR